MSLDLLRRLRAVHAFDHAPTRHDLGVYHVRFEELAPNGSPEENLASAARRGERIAVVGPSGSGKSSLIEHVLGPTEPGIAPILLPVFRESVEVVTSVQAVAGLIIQTLVDYADLTDTGRRDALRRAAPKRVVSSRSRTGVSVGGSWMGAGLSIGVRRQAPGDMVLPRTAGATLETVHQLLTAIQEDDLMPILVFDDTDRWFRSVGHKVSHHDLALAFFGRVLPELRQLPAGLVVAAHNNYLEREDLAGHLRDTIEGRIDIPTLDSVYSLGKVVHSRVIVHMSPDRPEEAPPLSEIADDDVLGRLYDLYRDGFAGSLRDVIRTVHMAVTDACNARFESITPSLIDQATASIDIQRNTKEHETRPELKNTNKRDVFVVYGRNEHARRAMFSFLRAIGLNPIDWSLAVNNSEQSSPYNGEVVETNMAQAQAIVALLTSDEVAYLRPVLCSDTDDPEGRPKGQARPNVIFEIGMALGSRHDQTIIVEIGHTQPFTDIHGRNVIRMTNDTDSRNALVERLRNVGCSVDTSGPDWLNAGDFSTPPPVSREAESAELDPQTRILFALLGGLLVGAGVWIMLSEQ